MRRIKTLAFLSLCFFLWTGNVHGKIIVGLSSVNIAFLPVYVSQEKGFFKRWTSPRPR